LRRSLLVTVTNYLGSTQFYLTRTHQKIGLTIITLTLMSLMVGGGALVWLGKAHHDVLQQAESFRQSDIKSKAQIHKLQTSVTTLLPAAKLTAIPMVDFQHFLNIAPAAAASLEHLESQTKHDNATIQALKQRLNELVESHSEINQALLRQTQSRFKMSQQLHQQNQEMLVMEQSLRQLQSLLGAQADHEFDLTLVPQMIPTAQHRLTLLALIPNSWPVAKKTAITSSYGKRLHPITGAKKMHKGIDIRCAEGAPILATANGVVASSIKSPGFGNVITLTHSYGFSSRYAHLQKRLVHHAEFVDKGQVIGLCGSTGLSNAPHLHYEIQFLAKQKNPWPFINWNLSNFDGLFQQVKEVQWQSLIKPTQLKTTQLQQ
jgi:murein DD-endopeptidase MepM/ murein hydrolase activator NlpD